MFLGSIGGCIGEVSALALLIGGGYLVVRGVIKLRIPVSYLGTMAVLSFAFAPMEPLRWMLYSLLGGGVLLGALFMASDYATSPALPAGPIGFTAWVRRADRAVPLLRALSGGGHLRHSADERLRLALDKPCRRCASAL